MGGIGIAIGLIIYGEKVMITIGKDILILDYLKGFVAQFATASCVWIYSVTSLPLSTHFCALGAFSGVYAAMKT